MLQCCCCCWFFLLLFHQQRKLNLLWVHHETFKWIGSSKNLVDRFADKECNSQEKSMSVVVKSIQSTISIYKTLPLLLHSNMMWLFCRQNLYLLIHRKKAIMERRTVYALFMTWLLQTTETRSRRIFTLGK